MYLNQRLHCIQKASFSLHLSPIKGTKGSEEQPQVNSNFADFSMFNCPVKGFQIGHEGFEIQEATDGCEDVFSSF